MIHQHVSESFEMRQEQVENVTDKTNVLVTLLYSFRDVLSQRECKPGIRIMWYLMKGMQRNFQSIHISSRDMPFLAHL